MWSPQHDHLLRCALYKYIVIEFQVTSLLLSCVGIDLRCHEGNTGDITPSIRSILYKHLFFRNIAYCMLGNLCGTYLQISRLT